MKDLFKDMEILSYAGKMMKILYFLKSALTVAIIVFSVLESKKMITQYNKA